MMNPMPVTCSLALAVALGGAPLANFQTPAPCSSVDRSGLSELSTLGDAHLESLRGGARPATSAFDDGEREMLRQAQARRPELAELRGGDMTLSDRDLKIILITAAVVIVLF